MKKLLTIIAVSAFAFIGSTLDTQARPHHRGHGYQAPQSQIYVSGYHRGRPIYTERYVAGYDRHGRPVFGYRVLNSRRGGYDAPRQQACQNNYSRGYSDRGYSSYNGYSNSGTRVTFSYSR